MNLTDAIKNYKIKIRSLGCVLFEILNLRKAFPYGQEGNPNIPDLGRHFFFSPILKKYFFFILEKFLLFKKCVNFDIFIT